MKNLTSTVLVVWLSFLSYWSLAQVSYSDWSNIATATTCPTVQNLTVTVTDHQVQFAWQSVGAATSYTLSYKRTVDASFTNITGLTGNSYNLARTGLLLGEYQWRITVIATNCTDDIVNGTNFQLQCPTINTLTVTHVGPNTQLSFFANTNSPYTIDYRPLGSMTWTNVPTTLLAPSTYGTLLTLGVGRYEWRVNVHISGCEVSYTGTNFSVCKPLTGLGFTTTSNSFTLFWNPVPGATNYTVKAYLGSSPTPIYSGITASTSWSQTSVIAANYTWTVEANLTGCSSGSTLTNGPSFAVTPCAPFTPTYSAGGINSFKVSWLPVTASTGVYTVHLFRNNVLVRSISTSQTSITGINLQDGSYYWTITFKVGMCTSTMWGGTFTVSPCSSFEGFNTVSASGGTNTFTLTWTTPPGTFTELYRYVFEVKNTANNVIAYQGRTNATSLTVNNVPAGTYSWRVYANLFGAPTTCLSSWKSGNNFTVTGGSSIRESQGEVLPWQENLTYFDKTEFVDFGYVGDQLLIERDNELSLNVFPNPTQGKVSFEIGYFKNLGKIEVFNLMGQLIFQTGVQPYETLREIDFSSQPKGLYVARITADGQTISKKFIIE